MVVLPAGLTVARCYVAGSLFLTLHIGNNNMATPNLRNAVPRIAVVGGGITGTLASLVLKNRNCSPVLIDRGHGGVGGRLRSNRSKLAQYRQSPTLNEPGDENKCAVDAGAQFFRATDPRLATVFGMLETAGMLSVWEGRFGLLGSRGGGFLPSSIVGGAGLRGMGRVGPDGTVSASYDEDSQEQKAQMQKHTDAGDFCGFAQHHRPDTTPTYVASGSNTNLCPAICAQAGIDIVSDALVVKASTVPGGGWKLEVEGNGDDDVGALNNTIFDALVLATHDASLAASTVKFIANAEAEAGISEADAAAGGSIQDRLNNLGDDLQSLRDDGRLPLFTWSGRFDNDFSERIPFDGASVPGSHTVQFLARESSKPGRVKQEQDTTKEDAIWTAVSTSAFAADVLKRLGSTREASEEASQIMSEEVSTLLASAASTNEIGAGKSRSQSPVHQPRDASAVRWASALTSKTLGLKEDSVTLAPWRLAICGDFVREQDAHETPFEAAALSGLEAGERVASFFAQQE